MNSALKLMFIQSPFSVSLGEVRVNQGSYLDPNLLPDDSHRAGVDAAALDLGLASETTVLSMAEGHIVDVENSRKPGEKGSDGWGNYVTVRHTASRLNGETVTFYATYAHLDQESLKWLAFAHGIWKDLGLEMPVHVGDTLGTVGNAGYGIHLHVQFSTTTTDASGGGIIADARETAANTALLKSLVFAGASSYPKLTVADFSEGDLLTSFNKDTGEIPGQYSPDGTGGGSDPDLTVTAVELSNYGASPGSDIEVSFTIANLGSAASDDARVRIVVSPQSDLGGNRHVLADLGVGELDGWGGATAAREFTRTVELPTTLGRSTYYIGVEVDHGDEVAESDEDNNRLASAPLAVGGGLSGEPDLRASFLPIEGTVFRPGGPVAVDFRISADADGAPPYTFQVFYSDDPFLGLEDTLVHEQTTSRGLGYIGVHYYDLDLLLPESAGTGVGYLFVQADPLNVLTEQKEDNNIARRELAVSVDQPDDDSLPDICADQLLIDPVIEAGGTFLYRPLLVNLSADDTVAVSDFPDGQYSFRTSLVMSVDPILSADDRVLHTRSQFAFDPGQITDSGYIITLPSDIESGFYYFGLVADRDGQLAEENELNNVTAPVLVEVVNNIPPSVDAIDDAIRLVNAPVATGNLLANDEFELLSSPQVDRVQGGSSLVGVEIALPSGATITINANGSYTLNADAALAAMTVNTVLTETVSYRARGVNGDVDTATLSITLERLDPNKGTSGKDVLVGTPWEDFINGLGGNDVVEGLRGADKLLGGGGNDSLIGGDGNDQLTGGTGNDRLDGGTGVDHGVFSGTTAVTVDLGLTTAQDTGQGLDTIKSIEKVTSGGGNDKLTGNASANMLDGGAGTDTLDGGGGRDILIGGAGRDFLNGGTAQDKFDYNATTESAPTATGRDQITGFVQGEDKIDLASIDANTLAARNQAFAFISSAAFSGGLGEVRAVATRGNTIISADVNGDKTADFQIQLVSVYHLTASDFVL